MLNCAYERNFAVPEKYCEFNVDYKKLKIYNELGIENVSYPMVVSVPHAGTVFPPEFLEHTPLSVAELRSNEDLLVDELAAPIAKLGIPVLSMRIARAFIDANRDKIELDAKMFYDYPADRIAIENNRCRFGLGLIHRIDAAGAPIYEGLLSYQEVQERIKNVYDVYHKRLQYLVNKCVKKFGFCLLLDYHSMPSKICNIIPDSPKVDFCLGDLFSQSCPPKYTEFLQQQLKEKGYMVTVNIPYSGAFTTFNYCQPRKKIYTLQLELNRGLYVDEKTLTKSPDFQRVSSDAAASICELAKKILDF